MFFSNTNCLKRPRGEGFLRASLPRNLKNKAVSSSALKIELDKSSIKFLSPYTQLKSKKIEDSNMALSSGFRIQLLNCVFHSEIDLHHSALLAIISASQYSNPILFKDLVTSFANSKK